MRFQLIGVNHKTAPVEVRERLQEAYGIPGD
jgi:glutamyl-tRNA reductase